MQHTVRFWIFKIFLILFGNLLLAVGVSLFVSPYGMITGGVGGIALLIEKLTFIPMTLAAMVLNLLLFLLGLCFLGKSFAVTTILSTFAYPVFLSILESIPALQNLCDDILLAALYSGLLMGAGIGLVMREGSSTGGMDIPPLIVHKKTKLSLALLVAVCDYAVLLLQVPFHSVSEILYGILSTLISSLTINQVILSANDKVQVMIITPAYAEVREQLIRMDMGVTLLEAKSGLEQRELQTILSVFPQRRLVSVQEAVLNIDPNAFLITSRVAEVHGRGFTKARFYSEWTQDA